MKSGLYKIVCVESSTVYVGGTINWKQRKAVHLSQLRKNKHHNIWLQRSWNKHGEQAFQFMWIRDVPPDDILAEEQKMFDEYPERCNIAPFAAAPMKGRHHSEETKAKFKLRKRGPGSMKGKHHSEESKALMSRIRQGKPIPALRGRKHSAEHKAKISAGLTGTVRQRGTGRGYCFHKHKRMWMVNVGNKFGGYFREEADAAQKAAVLNERWRLSNVEVERPTPCKAC